MEEELYSDVVRRIEKQYGVKSDRLDHHTYGYLYDLWFAKLKATQTVTNILEVGCNEYGGGCLLSLAEYFPDATVIGVDNRDDRFVDAVLKHDRIEIITADAYKVEWLNQIKNAEFNLIIDDASHEKVDQQKLLSMLEPRLAADGVYIIEDIAPAHWKSHDLIYVSGNYTVLSGEMFDMSTAEIYDNALIKFTRAQVGLNMKDTSIRKGPEALIKTIAITLSERPEERARLEQHLNERGVSNVHYMNGINAEVFGLKTEHTYEYDNPGTDYHIGAKDVGNVMSHYMAWTVAAALPHDLFLIVEGDVVLVEDWYARIVEALNDADDVMPDWDIMYVGSCHCLGKPKTRLKGDLWDVKYPLCTHAYLLTRKAVKHLIISQRDVYAAIDCALMQRSLPDMKVLTVLPRIADQVKWNDTSDAALKW